MAYGWLILRTLIVLAAVLALAYAALRLLARHLGRRQPTEPGRIEVLERQLIEPRRSLLVVRTADEYWLLASTEQGLNPVGKLDPAPWRAAATSSPEVEIPADAHLAPDAIAADTSLNSFDAEALIPAPQAEINPIESPSNALPGR
ncbi:flagellar biosynthetic protein FliO [Lujinxingia vulgaris]|uniref:Flagellar biosynthetic protein FliO n=1 Tax=Lujinxingia vulgaris TaxID=2600176 RepID=A0A5C6X0Z4_9DELT|nr:flagellar biosynthetic protein FliO [Lujinxingia vulgaris]TXD34758.1 flagellar biosynthetic protein FliO [Lujinxingia vulgaris]